MYLYYSTIFKTCPAFLKKSIKNVQIASSAAELMLCLNSRPPRKDNKRSVFASDCFYRKELSIGSRAAI